MHLLGIIFNKFPLEDTASTIKVHGSYAHFKDAEIGKKPPFYIFWWHLSSGLESFSKTRWRYTIYCALFTKFPSIIFDNDCQKSFCHHYASLYVSFNLHHIRTWQILCFCMVPSSKDPIVSIWVLCKYTLAISKLMCSFTSTHPWHYTSILHAIVYGPAYIQKYSLSCIFMIQSIMKHNWYPRRGKRRRIVNINSHPSKDSTSKCCCSISSKLAIACKEGTPLHQNIWPMRIIVLKIQVVQMLCTALLGSFKHNAVKIIHALKHHFVISLRILQSTHIHSILACFTTSIQISICLGPYKYSSYSHFYDHSWW